MSFTRQTLNDPFKACKLYVFPTRKPSDFISHFIKATVAACMVASTTLFFYLALSSRSGWFTCSECDRIFNIAGHQKYTTTTTMAGADIKLTTTTHHGEITNVSHILFGIGGSAKTWNQRRHYSELWWMPNITRGFVWLDEKPSENQTWPSTSPPYKVSADTSKFDYSCSYGSRSALHIARIVKESFELGLDNVRWLVMGDDDTVFFIENLVNVLGKYDHTQMYYIGGNSESIEQDVIHSYRMAYGGGGVAISYPLAAELVRVLDGCINRYAEFYGSDERIGGCMSEIGIPITRELGFHQVDIRGNPFGLLAAHPIAPLVSLHHLDYVEPLFPTMSQIQSLKRLKSAYNEDPHRTIQHSYCYDFKRMWSISVSWGYSVQLYPSIVRAKELETPIRTFKTWRTWRDEPFAFDTRRMSWDPCERPIVYFLDRVERVGNDQTLTTYVKHVEGGVQGCNRPDYAAGFNVQSFNVSAATFDPNLWRKAPRRQCCEVVDRGNGRDNTVQVKIRACNPFESVSPPQFMHGKIFPQNTEITNTH